MNRKLSLQGLFVVIVCYSRLARADHLHRENSGHVSTPPPTLPLTIQNYNIQGPVTLHGKTAVETSGPQAGHAYTAVAPHTNPQYYPSNHPAYLITAYKAELRHPESVSTGSVANKPLRPYYAAPYYNHQAPYQPLVSSYPHATYSYFPVYHPVQALYVHEAVNPPTVYKNQAQPLFHGHEQQAEVMNAGIRESSNLTSTILHTTKVDEIKPYHVKDEPQVLKSSEELTHVYPDSQTVDKELVNTYKAEQVDKESVHPTDIPEAMISETSQESHSSEPSSMEALKNPAVTSAYEPSTAALIESPEEVTTQGLVLSYSEPVYSSNIAGEGIKLTTIRYDIINDAVTTEPNEEVVTMTEALMMHDVSEATTVTEEPSFEELVTTTQTTFDEIPSDATTESSYSAFEVDTERQVDAISYSEPVYSANIAGERIKLTTIRYDIINDAVTTKPNVEVATTTEALLMHDAVSEATSVTEEPFFEELVTTTQTTFDEIPSDATTESSYNAFEVDTERQVDAISAQEGYLTNSVPADSKQHEDYIVSLSVTTPDDVKHTVDVSQKYPLPLIYRDLIEKRPLQQNVATLSTESSPETKFAASLQGDDRTAAAQLPTNGLPEYPVPLIYRKDFEQEKIQSIDEIVTQSYQLQKTEKKEADVLTSSGQLKKKAVAEQVNVANSGDAKTTAAESPTNPLPKYPVPLIYRKQMDQEIIKSDDEVVTQSHQIQREETKEADVIEEGPAVAVIYLNTQVQADNSQPPLDKVTMETTSAQKGNVIQPPASDSYQTPLKTETSTETTTSLTDGSTQLNYNSTKLTLKTSEETTTEVGAQSNPYSVAHSSPVHQEKVEDSVKKLEVQHGKMEQKLEQSLSHPQAPVRSSNRRRTYSTTTSTTTTTTPLPPVRTRPDYNKYRRTLISKAQASVAGVEEGPLEDHLDKSLPVSARNQRLHPIITKRPRGPSEIREIKLTRTASRNIVPTLRVTRTEENLKENDSLSVTKIHSDYTRGTHRESTESVEEDDDYLSVENDESYEDSAAYESVNKVRKVHQAMTKNGAPCALDEIKQALLDGEENLLPPGVTLDLKRNRAILPDGFVLYHMEDHESLQHR